MSSKGGKKEEVKAAPAKVAPTKEVAESSEGGNIMMT